MGGVEGVVGVVVGVVGGGGCVGVRGVVGVGDAGVDVGVVGIVGKAGPVGVVDNAGVGGGGGLTGLWRRAVKRTCDGTLYTKCHEPRAVVLHKHHVYVTLELRVCEAHAKALERDGWERKGKER